MGKKIPRKNKATIADKFFTPNRLLGFLCITENKGERQPILSLNLIKRIAHKRGGYKDKIFTLTATGHEHENRRKKMENITWSDGIGSRGRKSFLLFVRGDEIIPFGGQNIPGVVVVRGTDYEKAGKWSHTTYRLQLADGIRGIAGRDGWETGRFVEGLGSAVGVKTPDTWAEVAAALGVSVPSAMEFLRWWRPKAAEKLDEVEQSLVALEEVSEQETDSVIVTVSFGSPTNRQIREGWWESPKAIPGYNAEIRLKDRQQGWTDNNISVVGISGAVLSVKHSAGMHGGYYAVSVAVMPGTEVPLPAVPSSVQGEGIKSQASASPSGMNTLGDALRNAGIS